MRKRKAFTITLLPLVGQKLAAARVSAESMGADVAICVEDDGSGLSDELTLEALRPGTRLDVSAPGHGFGLSITRELAELYGGSLRLGRSSLGGVKALLTLPAARQLALQSRDAVGDRFEKVSDRRFEPLAVRQLWLTTC